MLRKLETTHFYDVDVKRNIFIDSLIKNASNANAQQKKTVILNFFSQYVNKISQVSMRTLAKILDDSLFLHTRFKNYDKVLNVYINDLIYVFCTKTPSNKHVRTLDLYLEDVDKHSQCNSKVIYAMLCEFVFDDKNTKEEENNLIFKDESEDEIEIDL